MNKVITIWGNAEFGCELAYVIAKKTVHNVLLLDIDLLSPAADLYLKINHGKNNRDLGLEPLIEEWANRKYLKADTIMSTAVERPELKNLHIITGCTNIEKFEYFTRDNLLDVIEKVRQYFEITILLVNSFIYDEYTAISLLKSDMNIVAIEPNAIKIREFNKYKSYLHIKQDLDYEKTKFVAWEYRPELHYTLQEFRELTGNYLGEVRYSSNRVACRSSNSCYSKMMEKKIKSDYEKIIKNLELTPRLSLKEKISLWFSNSKV